MPNKAPPDRSGCICSSDSGPSGFSGAMLKNIVDRAKTRAVKESIETGLDVALTVPLLAAAVEDEYRETRDSMADVDPEQWSRINGMDPIRRIRTAE